MPVNPLFDTAGIFEDDLYRDLMAELVYNHGIDCYYLPRDSYNIDDILGRSDGAFTKAYQVELFVKEYNNINYDYQLYEKFGLYPQQEARFVAEQCRFAELTNDYQPVRGDMIYVPNWDMLFQVNMPYPETLFDVGKSVFWEFVCVIKASKGELIQTGVGEIDKFNQQFDIDNADVNNETPALESEIAQLVDFNADNPFSGKF